MIKDNCGDAEDEEERRANEINALSSATLRSFFSIETPANQDVNAEDFRRAFSLTSHHFLIDFISHISSM